MSISPLDSVLHRGLFGDAEIEGLLNPDAEIAGIITVERALARVQGRLGVIPSAAAAALDTMLVEDMIPPERLASAFRRDGVVAPQLMAELRKSLPEDVAPWLHWGATSQDVADLSLMLRLKQIIVVFAARLERLIGTLAALAETHRDTPCLAHTRQQAAAPTLFGLKLAQWFAPFIRHRERLAQLAPRLFVVQFGGATGTLSALGGEGLAVLDGLATELDLAPAEPWHSARDRLEELAGILAMIASSCGRMGADLAMLARSETGEIAFAGAGGSSTLPQKQNPVLVETLPALARHVATLVSGMHHAAIHTEERDGAAWSLEWLTLPPMLVATGAALNRLDEAIATMKPDPTRMRINLDATRGLVLAEAATFALARHLPRSEAVERVKAAVATTLAAPRGDLVEHLAAATSVPVDWDAVRNARDALEPARQLLDRHLARAALVIRAA